LGSIGESQTSLTLLWFVKISGWIDFEATLECVKIVVSAISEHLWTIFNKKIFFYIYQGFRKCAFQTTFICLGVLLDEVGATFLRLPFLFWLLPEVNLMDSCLTVSSGQLEDSQDSWRPLQALINSIAKVTNTRTKMTTMAMAATIKYSKRSLKRLNLNFLNWQLKQF